MEKKIENVQEQGIPKEIQEAVEEKGEKVKSLKP